MVFLTIVLIFGIMISAADDQRELVHRSHTRAHKYALFISAMNDLERDEDALSPISSVDLTPLSPRSPFSPTPYQVLNVDTTGCELEEGSFIMLATQDFEEEPCERKECS